MGVIIVLWIILVIITISLARSGGRSGFGWFILSLFITPLLALIILLIVGNSPEMRYAEMRRNESETDGTEEEDEQVSNQNKAINDLEKFKKLLELGAISQDEFDAKKTELMPLLRQDFSKNVISELITESEEQTSLPETPLVQSTQPYVKTKHHFKDFIFQNSLFIVIILIILSLIGFVIWMAVKSKSPKNQDPKNNLISITQPVRKVPIDISDIEEEKVTFSASDKVVIDKFIAYYHELLSFKSKSDFITYGFGRGGNYYQWLEKVHQFETDANTQILIKLRVVPNDLEGLAMEYVSSKGKENEATKLFRGSIEAAIRQYKDITQETKISTTTAKPKQAENSLTEISLGKWKLTIPGINGQIIVEIFKKGNSYYCVENGKHKKLRREGDRYYVVGNEWGEYYRIVNDNLKMGDRQGDLPSDSGWKITKIK